MAERTHRRPVYLSNVLKGKKNSLAWSLGFLFVCFQFYKVVQWVSVVQRKDWFCRAILRISSPETTVRLRDRPLGGGKGD